MKDATLLFCYGLELNLTLLHCIVGGARPSCCGRFRLLDFARTWDVGCHLPNLTRRDGAVVEGVVVALSAEQRSRLEAARLVPALYRWRTVSVVGPWGRRRRALALWCPNGQLNSTPPLTVWQEVVVGALQQGFSDAAILELLALRPNDGPVIERQWGRPLPVLPAHPLQEWEALDAA